MDEIKEKWDLILSTLKTEFKISDISFKTWFEPLKLHHIDEGKLYLECQEQMAVTYMTNKYTSALKIVIAEITSKEFDIVFIGPKDLPLYNKEESNDIFSNVNSSAKVAIDDDSGVNPKCTFDNFVVGDNSRFAHSAAVAVAENPGETFNPLFIYGGVGLGKTHLMHAIANYTRENNPHMKIKYVSSENFTNEVIENIRSGNMSDFRAKYRKIDVLLIDDIQFIIGKESTQLEFFNTFNELRDSGKQVIISSDKPPKDMETLEERISSRLECGLTADIGQPDFETRVAILRKKTEQNNMSLSDDVLTYIANNFKSNVRELEGALNKLRAYSMLSADTVITVEIAEQELKNLISPNGQKEITIQLIIEVVCDHFSIPLEAILSNRRTNDVATTRFIIMYLAKNYTNSSLKAIGGALGGKDHSSVSHGIDKIEKDIKVDSVLKSNIDAIIKKINPS